jgi:hypothetical protein
MGDVRRLPPALPQFVQEGHQQSGGEPVPVYAWVERREPGCGMLERRLVLGEHGCVDEVPPSTLVVGALDISGVLPSTPAALLFLAPPGGAALRRGLRHGGNPSRRAAPDGRRRTIVENAPLSTIVRICGAI